MPGSTASRGVILAVQKQPDADTVSITRQIEAMLPQLQRVMPAGVRTTDIQFRQASFIETAIDNLLRVLIEALVCVAFVLFVFLLNWQTTLISLVAIPLSVLSTLVVFHLLGLSINTMTLGGLAIAIGALVDDAVVNVENIYRRLGLHRAAAGRDGRSTLEVIAQAATEVRSGIVYATVIIVLVFLPVFALSGIEGRLFTPLGIAFIVSILASLLVSLTVTPVLCYWLLPRMRNLAEHDTGLVRILKHWQKAGLEWCFERPAFVIGLPAVAVCIAILAGAALPRAFLPTFNEGTVLVSVVLQPGISLAESNRIGRLAEEIIAEVPEVRSVGRRTGRAELDEHAEGVHNSELDVDLRTSARSREEVLADIRKRLSVLPTSITVGQPIAHRLDHMLSGVRAQIALKIYGDDYDTLRGLAADLEARLKSIPGVVDLQTEKQVRIPQMQVRIDYAKAALYGLNPSQVTEALEALSNGLVVSQIIDQSKRFDVVMRLSDADRSTRALGDMLIESPAGRIPLASIAEVVETDGPNQIQRENGRRRIAVFANTDGSNMADVVASIRATIAATDIPAGLLRQPGGPVRSAGGSLTHDRPTVGRIPAVDLHRAVHALSVRRACLDHHGQRSAGPDRQRRRVVDRRAAVLRRQRHRLHHTRRHRHAQRHPEDQPLRQPGAIRGRELRAATGPARYARAINSGVDDGFGRRHRACAAAGRRRPAGQGNPSPRRRDHLRRPRLGDADRRLPDADAFSPAWTQTPGAAPNGGGRDGRSRGLLIGSALAGWRGTTL